MYLRLKFELIKKGYTIELFAKKIGMAEKTLRNKIGGVTDFTWRECLLIKEVLQTDIPLEELFEKENIETQEET